MKSYTDIEQSKKLTEILPIESADMCYIKHSSSNNPSWEFNEDFPPMILGRVSINKMTVETLPCWSLAALFELLPNCIEGAEPSLIKTFRNDYRIVYDIYDNENITSEDYTNPIDACYEMVLRLHKMNLL